MTGRLLAIAIRMTEKLLRNGPLETNQGSSNWQAAPFQFRRPMKPVFVAHLQSRQQNYLVRMPHEVRRRVHDGLKKRDLKTLNQVGLGERGRQQAQPKFVCLT